MPYSYFGHKLKEYFISNFYVFWRGYGPKITHTKNISTYIISKNLVSSPAYGTYYVNHVDNKTQYEAPYAQFVKRHSQNVPPVPEPNTEYKGNLKFILILKGNLYSSVIHVVFSNIISQSCCKYSN